MSGEGALGFGKSSSQSTSQQSTFADPAQAPFLDFLRNAATSLAGNQQGGLEGLFGLAQGLGGQGQGFLNNLTGIQSNLQQGFEGGFGQGQGGIDALTQLSQGQGLGQGQLQRIAGGNDPAVQGQIDALGGDLARQFSQLLPGIESQAIGGGQLGGGRQGVAQGLLGQATQDAFGRGAADIRFQDLNRQFGAAGQLQQGQLGAGGALGQLGGQQALGTAALNQQGLGQAGQLNLGGLESLLGQFNLGLQPFLAQFSPLMSLAEILGPTTVLSQGTSQGSAKAFNASVSGGGGVGFGSGGG